MKCDITHLLIDIDTCIKQIQVKAVTVGKEVSYRFINN